MGARGLFFFGLIFFAFGFVFLYFFFIQPAYKTIAARGWPQVDCVIDESKVGVHSDSDGTTYSIDITFRYEYNGKEYTSDTYDFFSGISSSGKSGKQRVVHQYPVESIHACYVNPNNPHEAVLSRDLSWTMLFGLLPVVFVLVGLGCMIGALRQGSQEQRQFKEGRGDDWLPERATAARSASRKPKPMVSSATSGYAPDETGGPRTVTMGSQRLGKAIGLGVFALLWNGFIWGFFVLPMVFGWSGGSWGGFDVCSTLFMIPFVLVGLGTIAGTGYYTLALFNPKVELQFDSGSTRLGETLALKWRLIGRPGRLNDFKLTLEAIEEAKYRRGTDTVTDTNTFIEIPLAEFDHIDFTWRGEGEASVELPRDAMHSFVADNNKIIWRVRAKGAIPRWPDVNDSTDITVLPEGA